MKFIELDEDMSKTKNGADAAAKEQDAAAVQGDPEITAKLATLRAQVRESFGKVVMAMMAQPRYRHQTIADLSPLVLEPLIRDRIAMAYPKEAEAPTGDMTGIAIWASVSEDVDKKIREQIGAGVFPVRLTPDDWNSGEINWLLDVIASDQKTTGAVIANFRQVVKSGELRIHPIVTRLVDKDMLEKMQRTS
ncbi:toxin-activating lysine-acyltransferase [uncultured Sulfitobacter sp.]|uniref:toxin-activating lysine-acyltransferase n=1 Tax=uncultured Sulfitobacter sp. TaxID=191468 RepID=UPI00263A03AE|nr:toxin-activating lysine-acyltransferase [uncultured Sulfitobacter sp.]